MGKTKGKSNTCLKMKHARAAAHGTLAVQQVVVIAMTVTVGGHG